jgi:hypothetical protein
MLLKVNVNSDDKAENQMFETIRNMEGLNSSIGRTRAWVRMSLMRQTLAKTWSNIFIENSSIVAEYYEPWSFFLSELIVPMSGMLAGLTPIQFNLFLKAVDLDASIDELAGFNAALLLRNQSISTDEEKANLAALLGTAAQQTEYLQDLVSQRDEELKSMRETIDTLSRQHREDANMILQLQLENQRKQEKLEMLHSGDLETSLDDADIPPIIKEQAAKILQLNEENQILLKRIDTLAAHQRQSDIRLATNMEILKATQTRLIVAIKAKEELKTILEENTRQFLEQ